MISLQNALKSPTLFDKSEEFFFDKNYCRRYIRFTSSEPNPLIKSVICIDTNDTLLFLLHAYTSTANIIIDYVAREHPYIESIIDGSFNCGFVLTKKNQSIIFDWIRNSHGKNPLFAVDTDVNRLIDTQRRILRDLTNVQKRM